MPVQWGTNPAVSQSVFLLRGTHAARPAAAPANQDYYYLETDTAGGTLFQSTGSAWVQVAGPVTDVDTATFAALTDVDTTGQQDQQPFMWDQDSGKYIPLTGVMGFNAGSLIVAGAMFVGNVPAIEGPTSLIGAPVSIGGGSSVLNGLNLPLDVIVGGTMDADRSANVVRLERNIDRAGFTVSAGVLTVVNNNRNIDGSPTPPGEPSFQVINEFSAVVMQVNDVGGLAMFSQTPPTVQPTGGAATAGATYGATEQTMLQAVYNAARAIGLLS